MGITKGAFHTHKTVNPDEENPLDKDGFVGVDPVYQNYASETDKPLEGEESDADEKVGAETEATEPKDGDEGVTVASAKTEPQSTPTTATPAPTTASKTAGDSSSTTEAKPASAAKKN